ncbi:MAG: exo-beta-N-acetylmuramidase NamZ family protein [Chthoniobacterales bacterium]
MERRRNKKWIVRLAGFWLGFATAHASIEPGIDVLASHDYSLLAGKRVGLITNQTGVNANGTKTRLLLKRHCNLVALYTPEHGLDGTEKAGRYVKSRRDPLTGVIAHSLYGPTRKPTPEMLRGVDVLVFDLQDIGCRSYTYISTMGRCMEAAGENRIPFVVLDRPNPVGGLRVEGPSVEPAWRSFVSEFPIPYVYGLTVGELARMINERHWISTPCNLTVVPMRGWERGMTWDDTGLRWVASSPNIPHSDSPLYYIATGLVGELSGVEVGIPGPRPFQSIGARWLNSESFTRYLRSIETPGVQFRPWRDGPTEGSSLAISPDAAANLTGLGVYLLSAMNRQIQPDIFRRTSASKLDLFYKVCGGTFIRTQMREGESTSRIVAAWHSNEREFRKIREKYLLY